MMKSLFKSLAWSFTFVMASGSGSVWAQASRWSPSPNEMKLQSVEELFRQTSVRDVLVIFRDRTGFSLGNPLQSQGRHVASVYRQLVLSAQTQQRKVIHRLQKRGLAYQSFYINNSLLVKAVNKELVLQILQLEEVESVRANAQILSIPVAPKVRRAQRLSPNLEADNLPAGLKEIGAERVWNEFKVLGEGITIGGQDSGFSWSHEALAAQYRGRSSFNTSHDYNWHNSIHSRNSETVFSDNCKTPEDEPCDDEGHGTHTMGIMVGDNQKGKRIGVAPKAKWMACRNMNKGSGTVASYLECFEFMMAPYAKGGQPQSDGRPDLAPHIVNNSWSCSSEEGCKGDEFIKAVRAFKAAGIMVVAAATNTGPDCGSMKKAPGFYSGELLSVAAYDVASGEIADFSGRGPSAFNGAAGPSITAPGVGILSSVLKNSYEEKDGTSMASPHVAGVVALLWSAKPKLIGQVDSTMQILEASATPKFSTQNCGDFLGTKIPNAVFGHGIVNAYKAIQLASQMGF